MSQPHIHPPADPAWIISYGEYDPEDEGRREATLALGNGVFVTRAASCDSRADQRHYPGTYSAACYEHLISRLDGKYEEETESLANLPNWLALTFKINDGPWFHLDEVKLLDYCHTLDLQRGIACREFTFSDHRGRCTHVHEMRFNSMAEPNLCGLRLQLTPKNWSGQIEFRSAIEGNILNQNVRRYAGYEPRHIVVLGSQVLAPKDLCLHARTRCSKIGVVEIGRTLLNGDLVGEGRVAQDGTSIGHYFKATAAAGEKIAVEKLVSLQLDDGQNAGDPAEAARSALAKAGSFASLHSSHERAWEKLWRQAAMSIENESVELALRFHVFHILQTASPHTASLDTGVPARGWHGEGYRGHIFWDDLFVFPFFNFRFPELGRALLLYRYRRLDAAREAAREAGYRGAMYPWRSAHSGREVTPRHQKNLLSGHWMPDPTHLQRHINAAVVFNVWHYYRVTGDGHFLSQYGAEMVFEIARFWASIVTYSHALDRYEIKGVIGPDEYHNSYPDRAHPGLDNNAYTNVMAVWSLCRALEVLDHLPSERRHALAQRLQLDEDEVEQWDVISRKMRVDFHGDDVISQFEGFEKLREFSHEVLPRELSDKRVDWALEAIGESADCYQVTKQADALTLFYLLSPEEVTELLARLGYRFDRRQLLHTADYYLSRTTHRSSLSRVVYAGALAQVDPERSWNLYRQALDTDLHALKGESIAEGIHLAAMGGTLDVLQRHYLGINADPSGALRLEPVVPAALGKVRLGLHYRGGDLVVLASSAGLLIRSEVDSRSAIKLLHRGESKMLRPGEEFFIETGSPGEREAFG